MKAVCSSRFLTAAGIVPHNRSSANRTDPYVGFFVERLPMKIVALDLGKFKTVACIYVEGKAEFIKLNACCQKFTELFKQHAADMVVFETCTAAGWLSDLCEDGRT
jgi:hypothetical protein